jgi:hypothetical protein
MEVLGNEPKDRAELELYNYLNAINYKGTAWFNLDIPGTNEIDCLMWIDEIGMFSIEVKGYSIDDFDSLSLDHIEFSRPILQQRYGIKPPPWKQAKNASRIISTHLSNIYYKKKTFNKTSLKNECVPYIDSVVYFPFISETSFLDKFPKAGEILKDYIIFNNCYTEDDYLINKLNNVIKIRKDIQAQKNTGEIKWNYDKLITIYKENVFLSTPDLNIEDKYDFKLLKLLENNELNKEINSIDFNFPIYRYGYAGTGKTVIALKILQNLALAEKQVLFTCYNKVLASDLKRLNKLSYNNALKFFENITIKDVHDLIIEYSPFGKIINETNLESTSSDFFESVVDGIIKSGYFEGCFEYIVIDEAQDLKDYGWKLLKYLARNKENSLIVLNGKEQNLYLENPSFHLKQFEDKIRQLQNEHNLTENFKQKRRIYRNKTRTFLFAHSFLDYYPESKLAIEFINKNETKKDNTLEFDRNLGNFPFVIKRDKAKIKSALKKAIHHCIKENENFGLGESGILIVVPWKYSPKHPKLSYYRDLAVQVLKEINIDYLDYTVDQNRRLDYLINQVRIVSFHSCRGIESNFTLILGFEELFELSKKAKCDYHKLGYIILSRAKYETYVFIDDNQHTLEARKFLDFSESIFKTISPQEKFIF